MTDMLKRVTQFAAKVEGSPGVPEALAAADVFLEVEDLDSTYTRERKPRNPLRRSLSKVPSIVGKSFGDISGKAELVGGGAAGTKPPISKVLLSAGYQEFVTKRLTLATGTVTGGPFVPGERIIDSSGGLVIARLIKLETTTLYYMLETAEDFAAADTITGVKSAATVAVHATTPVITALNWGYRPNTASVLAYTGGHYTDGKRKLVYGAKGNGNISCEAAGDPAYFNFSLMGTATKPIDAALLVGAAPTIVEPEAFLSAGVFVHADQDLVCIDGFNLDLGNTVVPKVCANSATGIKQYRISDRAPKITIAPEEQLEAEIDFWLQYDNGAKFGFFAQVGTTASKRLAICAPNAQYDGMTNADREGVMTLEANLNLCGVEYAGDDELMLAFF